MRSPGWNTARSISRSYSTRAQRLVGIGVASMACRLSPPAAVRQCPLKETSRSLWLEGSKPMCLNWHPTLTGEEAHQIDPTRPSVSSRRRRRLIPSPVERIEATPNRALPWPVTRPARRSWTRARRLMFVGFVTPAVVVLVLVTVLPLLYLVVTSFTPLDLTNPSSRRWAGLTNYRQLAADGRFWNSVRVQAQLSFWTVSLQMVIGFAIALLLNGRMRFLELVRAAFIIPSARAERVTLPLSLHLSGHPPRVTPGVPRETRSCLRSARSLSFPCAPPGRPSRPEGQQCRSLR